MAAGIPFIMNKNSIFDRQLVQAEQCGVVVDGSDSKSYRRGPYLAYKEPSRCLEDGGNGRHVFENKYNWEAELKKLCLLILTVAKGKNR